MIKRLRYYEEIVDKQIEKDWWVTVTLKALFQTECADSLLFKGGISLSKGFNIIEQVCLFFCCNYAAKLHIIFQTKQKYASKSYFMSLFSPFIVPILTIYLTYSNIKYIDNQLVTVIKIQMICKCKYKTI